MDLIRPFLNPAYIVGLLLCSLIEARALAANADAPRPGAAARIYPAYLAFSCLVDVALYALALALPPTPGYAVFNVVVPVAGALALAAYAVVVLHLRPATALAVALVLLSAGKVASAFFTAVLALAHAGMGTHSDAIWVFPTAARLAVYAAASEAILVRYWPRRPRNSEAPTGAVLFVCAVLAFYYHHALIRLTFEVAMPLRDGLPLDALAEALSSPYAVIALVLTFFFAALPVYLGTRAGAAAPARAPEAPAIASNAATTETRPSSAAYLTAAEAAAENRFRQATADIRRTRTLCHIVCLLFFIPSLYFLRGPERRFAEAAAQHDAAGMRRAAASMHPPALIAFALGLLALWAYFASR